MEKIQKYELLRGELIGHPLGIPAYKDAGDPPRYFTGTNKEANDFRRELDKSEADDRFKWMIHGVEGERG